MKSSTLWTIRAQLGECPTWDESTQTLLWVDIRAPRLHRHTSDGTQVRSWPVTAPIGAFALLADGTRALVCMSTGLALLDLETGALDFLLDPEPDRPANRLNEGKVSPCGRHFVFGSMDDRPEKEPTGSLYCLSADRSLRVLTRGLTVANGVAWSPDARTLYFSDSRAAIVWACDWDGEGGTIANRRIFATPTPAQGRPDGAAMDDQGHYWSAGVSAGRLNRFDPNGTCVASLELPVQAPTMPAFGGPGRTTLFITSHRHIPSPHTNDGAIVTLGTTCTGTPQPRFKMT